MKIKHQGPWTRKGKVHARQGRYADVLLLGFGIGTKRIGNREGDIVGASSVVQHRRVGLGAGVGRAPRERPLVGVGALRQVGEVDLLAFAEGSWATGKVGYWRCGTATAIEGAKA